MSTCYRNPKKRGETEGNFQIVVRAFKLRQPSSQATAKPAASEAIFEVPPEAWGHLDAHLSNTLDWLNFSNHNAAAYFGDNDTFSYTQTDHLSPHL